MRAKTLLDIVRNNQSMPTLKKATRHLLVTWIVFPATPLILYSYVNYLWVTKLVENVWVIVDNHTAKSFSHKIAIPKIKQNYDNVFSAQTFPLELLKNVIPVPQIIYLLRN